MARRRTRQTNTEPTSTGKAPMVPIEEPADPADHPGVADRATMLEWLRSELVGPQLCDHFPRQAQQYVRVPHVLPTLPIEQGIQPAPIQVDPAQHTVLFHMADGREQEIIWYRESPRQRYGTGLLYPEATPEEAPPPQSDPEGDDTVPQDSAEDAAPADDKDAEEDRAEEGDIVESGSDAGAGADTDELEVASRDRFRPSTMGLSFHAKLPTGSAVRLILPEQVPFHWQVPGRTFPVNGWYRRISLRYSITRDGEAKAIDVVGYARYPVSPGSCVTVCDQAELVDEHSLMKRIDLPSPAGLPQCPLRLDFCIFPRRILGQDGGIRPDEWLITVILRNRRSGDIHAGELLLFQAYFAVELQGDGATFLPYPESHVRFENLTDEERNLELLYQDQLVWGTGHGCAAGWDGGPGRVEPAALRAEVLPAVETPSMTPDLTDTQGSPIKVSLHEMKDLPDTVGGTGWMKLHQIRDLYDKWIIENERKIDGANFPDKYRDTARTNIEACKRIQRRIAVNGGVKVWRWAR